VVVELFVETSLKFKYSHRENIGNQPCMGESKGNIMERYGNKWRKHIKSKVNCGGVRKALSMRESIELHH
jgi:hypothetical protein